MSNSYNSTMINQELITSLLWFPLSSSFACGIVIDIRLNINIDLLVASLQRVADERTAKATELEQKVALLEVECATLNQELQDMEARVRREQKKSPEEANQVKQAEMQKMRVEMAAMKRDAEHYSRQVIIMCSFNILLNKI
ncbi:golgin candidate 1-like [Cajanus cajan]|uniref:golgin candidate 1-like n=1 Tax=Cajanus cajan TaxID=3821 RepID=UPI00098D8261|nr:golgin candidate 1-like [Cajanus cajan]